MRFTGAHWRGPIDNRTPGAMRRPILGLVLHIEQGSEAGTDQWFHNPGARASAHFGNPKAGPLDQWVDTDDEAWAEVAGNTRYVSVEHEGHSGEALTDNQVENAARLLAWLHFTEAVPLALADRPGEPGLGFHAMGGQAWGGHFDCPGDPVVSARARILARAGELVGQSPTEEENMGAATMTPTGKGTWRVHPDGTVFTAGDAEYYGGYLDLPDTEREGQRSFVAIERLGLNMSDGYVLLADDGAAYRFNAAVWAQLHPAGST